MVKVAVAGGTGHVGQTLVEGLVDAKEHQVFVLTRKDTKVFANLPVHALTVDYGDQDSLQAILDQHGIEAVISTIGGLQVFDAQVSLIRACAGSSSVKRFAPSEWLLDFERPDDYLLYMPMTLSQRNTVKELRKHPGLEWTLFHNGYFADYFGQPFAPTHMPSEVPFIDIEARKATIPGTGDEPVVWTHTTDVAKFVGRALSMPPGTWPEHAWIVGDKVSLNRVLAAAERARGGVKFDVARDSLERLKGGQYTPIPANAAHAALYSTPEFDATPAILAMFAGIGAAMASGDLDIAEEDSLNARFPDIETIKVESFIEKYWSGK